MPRDLMMTYDQDTDRTVHFPDAIQPGPNEPWFDLRWFWRPEHGWRARTIEREPVVATFVVIGPDGRVIRGNA